VGWTARVQFPAGAGILLLTTAVTGSGVHPASYMMGTGAFSPGIK